MVQRYWGNLSLNRTEKKERKKVRQQPKRNEGQLGKSFPYNSYTVLSV